MQQSTDGHTRYDNSKGIETYLGSLEGFQQLIKDRRDAAARKETLSAFVLLKHWLAKTDGTFARVDFEVSHQPVDRSSLPLTKVVAVDHLFSVWSNLDLRHGWQHPAIPTPMLRCSKCHRGWTIDTAWDCTFIVDWFTRTASLDDTPATLAARTIEDGVEIIRQSEVEVRKGDEPASWVNWETQLPSGTIVQLCRRTYSHGRCVELNRRQTARGMLETIVKDAGVYTLYALEAIDESTRGVDQHTYLLQLPQGDIRMTWSQKTVLLDWSKFPTDYRSLTNMKVNEFRIENAAEGLRKVIG